MKTFIRSVLVPVIALLLSASPAFAQERYRFEQPELDQMLAPIALYPDALLSQILMASTYPLEVVQAARWSREHPHLKGQDAVRAARDRDWDPSVQSLVAFPEVLSMMDQKFDWTDRLGNAFLAQQAQVMDTVQYLRRKAEVAGNLHSNDRVRVLRQDEIIIIEPASPRIVYVPYYNPVVVYGSWWWPAYPPVYWAPWPGYHTGPAFISGFYWGSGITISTGFFFGAFDWHLRHARIVHVDHYRSHAQLSRRATIVHDKPGVWRHDPGHRRGAPYRQAATHQYTQQAAPSRIDAHRNPQERITAPGVRLEDTRQPGSRSGANENIRREATVASPAPAPRVERREEGREAPDARRQEREYRQSTQSPTEAGRFQRNIEPQTAPVVREELTRQPAARSGSSETIRQEAPVASTVPRVERRDEGREAPDARRQEREYRQSTQSPTEAGRFQRSIEPQTAPAVREELTRQPAARSGSNETIRQEAPVASTVPRVERRNDGNATPGAQRQGRELRESPQSAGSQRERSMMRGNEPSEAPGQAGRFQRNAEVRPAAAPAASPQEPARSELPRPAARHNGERSDQRNMGRGAPSHQPSAANPNPSAHGAANPRHGREGDTRRGIPSAGRMTPG